MPTRHFRVFDNHLVDAIRVLSMDAVQRANSGHPGAPMGLASAAYELWTRHLRHSPVNPLWPDRDRFVLSAGHASMLLYSLLYLTGYDLSLDDLKAFRQWGSVTPGHPERGITAGVEVTTGPLGQGVANSVGMALAERWLAHRFNRPGHEVIDHYTYVICSDGDLMEGISHEAAELAGHQRLGKLIWIYDDNRVSIEGDTALALSTDQRRRFEAYGWRVLRLPDGNHRSGLRRALRRARAEGSRPTLIILRTQIAYGSPGKAGSHEAHGAPLGEAEVRATKAQLGYPSLEPFWVDPDALVWCREHCRERGRELEESWRRRLAEYSRAFPREARELESFLSGGLPDGWDEELRDWRGRDVADATRNTSGRVLNALARRIPNLIGGSADLGSSTKTDIEGGGSLLAENPTGRVLHFGVREHAMGAILNGILAHGGLRGFVGTFLVFSDYMRPAIRMAALMKLPAIYVFTHDSIGLGEDGPTHQPVEHLMSLRAIPNLMDLRPADAAETAVAWRLALERGDGPTFLSLTRQSVPPLAREGEGGAEDTRRGAYILREADSGQPRVILIGTGSEVQVAVAAREILEGSGIPTRVVSMPSWFLFHRQDPAYRNRVLPPEIPVRVSVEAGTTLGWERWTGPAGGSVGLDRFGASAPWPTLYEKFGITAEAVAGKAMELLGV